MHMEIMGSTNLYSWTFPAPKLESEGHTGGRLLTIREIHGLRVTHMEIQEHQLIQSLVRDLTNTKMKVVNLYIRKRLCNLQGLFLCKSYSKGK